VCSSRSGTEEPYVVDSDARSHQAQEHAASDRSEAYEISPVEFSCTSVKMCCRIQHPLKLVSRRPRRSDKHRVAVVYSATHDVTKKCTSDFVDSVSSDRRMRLSWRSLSKHVAPTLETCLSTLLSDSMNHGRKLGRVWTLEPARSSSALPVFSGHPMTDICDVLLKSTIGFT